MFYTAKNILYCRERNSSAAKNNLYRRTNSCTTENVEVRFFKVRCLPNHGLPNPCQVSKEAVAEHMVLLCYPWCPSPGCWSGTKLDTWGSLWSLRRSCIVSTSLSKIVRLSAGHWHSCQKDSISRHPVDTCMTHCVVFTTCHLSCSLSSSATHIRRASIYNLLLPCDLDTCVITAPGPRFPIGPDTVRVTQSSCI